MPRNLQTEIVPMVEPGVKIKRKIYKFELKKRYQYVGHYRTKERPPIERIKDGIKKLLTPKKEKREVAVVSTAPPKGGFNFLVFGGFILIALVVVGIGLLYLTASSLPPAGSFQPVVEQPQMTNQILGGQILSSGDRNSPKHVAAVLVNYSTSNINNYSITLSTYDQKLPSEVFILDSNKFEATTYPEFLQSLRSNLAKRDIILNEITIKQLDTIPQGALVIVPSGVIPKELLGFDSPLTMDRLINRGVVVLYIGQPFTKMLNGTLVFTTPSDTVQNLPITFDQSTQLQSTPDINLYQPLYQAMSRGAYTETVVYGSISVLTKGDGAFIFVPQTLDGGWRGNATSAANDISKLIYDIPWATPNAPSTIYNFTNSVGYNGTQYFFSDPFDNPNATVKVDFNGTSTTSNYPIEQSLYIRLSPERNNDLYTEQGGLVVPTNITGQPVRMNALLREPQPAQPNMYLVIDDANGTEQQNLPEGNVNVQADQSFDVQVYVPKGEYIVKLIDDQGNTYTQTYMQVVSPEVTFVGNDNQHASIYNFQITMGGQPYQLSGVTASVDNGTYGTYNFPQSSDKVSIDVGQYTSGDFLPYGKHTFVFTSGNLVLNVHWDRYKAPSLFDNPLFYIVFLVTGGLVGIGAIFARAEEVFYSIDIPDFPPVARTRIPISPDVVLSIFQKVNETYRWQNTPLTTSEVKNGFKDIFISGKPIYITDYNVEFLLETLEKRGLVKESLNYYGLASWEEKSKHSIEYLAIMRRLRDICVNNAIPFTSIGESEDADSVITVVGQQMSLHFYERKSDLRALLGKVISTVGHGITIMLFKSDADKEFFQTLLNSSPTVAPLILKMEAESSSLLLLTTDELEKLLLEFKSM